MKNVMSILNEGLVNLMNQNEELSKFNPSFDGKGITLNEVVNGYIEENYICVEEENGEMILSLYGDNPIPMRYWGCDKLNPQEIGGCILFLKGEFDKMMNMVFNNPSSDFDLDNYVDNELITNFR
jgi:hypothetical protein